MKFIIYRDAIIDGREKRKVLIEWNSEQIFSVLLRNFKVHNLAGLREAWEKTISEFKKETIRIP